tara:strand:+ start:496 stop:1116 length:621 start_codon:yes stop_codon:yes gene_type:complete
MQFFVNALNTSVQHKIAKEVSRIAQIAPFFTPFIPKWNKPFKIQITNAGEWGWKSDKYGYGYIKKHPLTGKEWPTIPSIFLQIWKEFTDVSVLPNCCLINLYKDAKSSLGLHQDKDENDFSFPVLTISLGNKATFNYGKTKKLCDLKKILLLSGSIVILHKKSRLYYHSISKISETKDSILYFSPYFRIPPKSRVSITLRRFAPSK